MKFPFHSSDGRAGRGRAVHIVAAFFITCSLCLQAQTRPSEYQVKAAYLYNFGKFVNWPGDHNFSDFNVCVLGTDPFGPTLDRIISNATINGKKVLAKRIAKPQDAAECRIVFLGSSEASRLPSDIAALNKLGVLTVSDIPDFIQRGGMIQFVLDGDRVRFEVDLTAAKEAGLSLSSELLKVAMKVRGNALPQ